MPTDDLVSPVARVSFFPRDFARSLAFWRDAVGLALVDEKRLEGPAAGRLVGLESCRLHIAYLQSEHNEFGMVGLFGVDAPPLPPLAPPAPVIAAGQAVVTFATRDAEALRARLAAHGAHPVLGPTRYGAPGLGDFVEFLVTDPDGHLLSFVEFRPARPGLSRSWYGPVDAT